MSPQLFRTLNEATRTELVDALAHLTGWTDSFYEREKAPIRSGTDVVIDFFKKLGQHETRVR
jgi:hypothetical protein